MKKSLITKATSVVVTASLVFGGTFTAFADTSSNAEEGVKSVGPLQSVMNLLGLDGGVVISAESITVDVGGSSTIKAFLDSDSGDGTIMWTSNDEEVATVEDGTIKGISVGKATITASCGEYSKNCVVRVIEPSIKLSSKSLDLDKGESQKLTATVKTGDNNPKVEWKSSKEKVATVDKDGNVKAVGAGTAVITATYKDAEEICVVIVDEVCTPAELNLKLEGANVRRGESSFGSEQWFYAGDGKEGTFKVAVESVLPVEASAKVNWSSNNKNFPINSKGEVTVPANLSSATYVTFTATSAVDSSITKSKSFYILPEMEQPGIAYSSENYLEIPSNGIESRIGEGAIGVNPSQYKDYNLVRYEVSDESIAKVENGSIFPQKPGRVTISVIDKEDSSRRKSFELEIGGFYIMDSNGRKADSDVYLGKTLQLSTNSESDVTWKSSDDEIATISESGLVTGKKVGRVKITATAPDCECTYEINVKEEGKLYPSLLFTTSSSLYEDSGYTTSLSRESRYLNDEVTYTSYIHSFAVSDMNDRTYYMKESTSAQSVAMGVTFDSEKVKAEIIQEGKDNILLKSATTSSVSVVPGDNNFKVKVTSLENEKDFAEYNFKVIVGYSTNANVSSLSVKPSSRANYSTKMYKPAAGTTARAEGMLYKMKDDGSINYASTGFAAATTDYTAFFYDDAEDFVASITPADRVSGHVGYSVDGGLTWAEGKAVTLTTPAAFDKDGMAKIMFKCVSDSAYKAAKDAEVDPFKDENLKVYTVNAVKLTSDLSNSTDIEKIEFDDNCKEGTPGYVKGAKMAATLVAHDADTVKVKFTTKKGMKLYNGTSTADRYVMTDISEEAEWSIYELDVKTPLSTQGAQVTQNITASFTDEEGNTVNDRYTIYFYKIGTTSGVLKGMPDKITDYMCCGSQYTSGGNTGWGLYGVFPEKIFMGAGNWSTCISLGNFGGYMTLYYDEPIKDDENNIYGIDFTVFGNSNGGQSFSEPGNVLVSEDGKTWYTLAGSEHYDANTRWDYTVKYKKSNSDTADYEDNDGNGGTLGTAFSPLRFPTANCYPLYDWSQDKEGELTVSGVRLYGTTGAKGSGIEMGGAGALPAFGYVDVHTNSKTVAGDGENVNLLTTPTGNPYTDKYEGYGDGFDLKWAVDKDGNPVDVSNKEFHYVKVQSATFINAGAMGEKSTEISAAVRTSAEKEAIGTTEAPKVIKVGDAKINITEGRNVYYASVKNVADYDVSVEGANDDANIFINNERTASRSYTALPDKGIVRVIVQEGTANPVIYYVHVVEAGKDAVTDVKALIDAACDAESVKAASEAFNKLSDEDKAKIETADIIKEAAAKVEIESVETAIGDLGEVNSSEVAEAVKAAEKAYNELPEESKKAVSNADVLKEKLSQVRVFETNELIKAIGEVDKDSDAKIKDARAAYEKLSDKEKAEVSTYQLLVNAELKYELIIVKADNQAKDEEQTQVNEGVKDEISGLKNDLAKAKFKATKIKLSYSNASYSGKAKKPSVTVTYYGKKLVKNQDYVVKYVNNVKVGKATVVITGKGKYAGVKKVTFKINPKKTTIKQITKAKTQLTVKWAKVDKQVTGYQISYAKKANMKNAKTITVKGYKNTTKKLTKLNKKTTYQVKVRTYKVVDGKTYYSGWSKAKVVTTKK